MRALLINAKNKTVTVIQVDTLQSIQEAIKPGGCTVSGAGRTPDRKHYLYVDDDGLFNGEDFFIYPGFHQPFAGNGVIVGINSNGDSTPNTMHELCIAQQITWLDLNDVAKLLAGKRLA